MKQTAIDFIVKELDILHRERKEKVIDAYNKGQENPYEYSEDNEVNYYDGNNYYIEKYEKVF